MDVEFSDLSYIVRNVSRGGSRTILKSVSGRFRSGQLSAIMGPSGAGKSSLLNAVSGYKSVGVTGVLKTNGALRDEFEFHKSSCYITQEDLLQPLLSALEAMQIAASLKLPTKTSQEQRNDVIVDILKDLGLWDHRHTRTEKLSGGQKKRLSIALELVNNPPVIFLDEPTSGLDDVSTRHCVAMLRRIAQQGRTVVCTIHQPSAALFATFDQVYIIGKGMCVYQGSTKALVSFLSSAGIECPTHYNPADFILEILETGPMVKTLSEMIGNGKLNKCNSSIIEPLTKQQGINIDKSMKRTSDNSLSVRRKLSFWSSNLYLDHPTTNWTQFYILLRRMFIQILRNTQGLRIQFFHHLLCGLAVGGMFYNNANDGTQMFNHLKFCVGVTLFVAYTQVMVPVLVYPQEVKLVKKEYFNRWYNITPYYAALTISKLPFQFTFNMIFLTLVYFMTGLPADVSRFALFCLVTNLVSLSAEGIGLAIGSIFNVTNGSAVGPMTIAPFLGLACYGFDFAKEITWYMSCLMKTSFLRSGVVGLILCVFGYGRRRLDCPDVYCHFDKPDVLLEYLDLTQVSVWHEVATLTALICIFRTISYLSLRMRFVL